MSHPSGTPARVSDYQSTALAWDMNRTVLITHHSSLITRLWRRALSWRYRVFQQHRHDNFALEEVVGTPILVLPRVFNPKLFRSGEFLARWAAAVVRPGETVLDLGTGSGVGAVFAARQAAQRVVAVDINPAAVRCARINALLHGLEDCIDVRPGDLFAPVAGERFDLVLFNPPYYRGVPRDALDQAFRSNDVVERFAAGLEGVLTPGGRAIVVLSSDAEPLRLRAIFQRFVWRVEVLEERNLINETILVWELTR